MNTDNSFTYKLNLKNKYGKGVNINNSSKKAFQSNTIFSWCSNRRYRSKRISLAEGLFDLTLGLTSKNALKYTTAFKNLSPIGGMLSSKYVNDNIKPSRRFQRIYTKKLEALDENGNVPDKAFILQEMNIIKQNSRQRFANYRIINYVCSDKNYKGTGIALILLEMTHLPKTCDGLIAHTVSAESKRLFESLGFYKMQNSDLNKKNTDIYFLKKSLCTSPKHIIQKLDTGRQNPWIQKYYKMCFRPSIKSLVSNNKNIMNYNNKNTFKFSCI